MKFGTVAGALAALALAVAIVPSARADEAKEAQPIQFVDGWEAGKAVAAKSGKLMFVYVGRKSPP